NAPDRLGSGGSDEGSGGGAVIANVSNSLIVSGAVLADGSGGTFGGSGGSIYFTAPALSGTGVLQANGSATNVSGAGGRIAVIASTSTFSGSMRAYGVTGNTGIRSSAAGTIFIKTPGTNGSVIINNNNVSTTGRLTYLSTSTAASSFTLDSIYSQNKASMTFV